MNFDEAMVYVFRYEGGLCTDSGGLTKYGISQNAYPKLDIRSLTKAAAKEIYRKDYWARVPCYDLPDELRFPALDCAVNEGVGKAREFIEQSGNDAAVFMDLRRRHYKELARRNPKKYRRYLSGWLNRLRQVEQDNLKGESAPPPPPPQAPELAPSVEKEEEGEPIWTKADTAETVKPIVKSKIAGAAAALGGSSAASVAVDDEVTASLLMRLIHQPAFWAAVAILVFAAAIIYWRWRDHGRGQL